MPDETIPLEDKNDMTRATFRAAFPPIQSAIKIYGNGDGMRFQLDVPETEMDEGVKLLGMRGVVLKVSVSIDRDQERNYGL